MSYFDSISHFFELFSYYRRSQPRYRKCPHRLINTATLRLRNFREGYYSILSPGFFSREDYMPHYAILSHRWITGEEVTYQEFLELRDETKRKSGYHKIVQACKQALEDGFDYIWVDTCCIDKGDHADVARNIKSMYAYYQNSEVCYAYLVDVPQKRFVESEWFERGWTLQELLAPRKVVFFNKEWTRLGTKDDLEWPISLATAIPRDVIVGRRFVEYVDVVEKMTWSMGRKTTKPQDQAYCLLGIFGVSMEPNYDEDVGTAFARLHARIRNKTRPPADHGLVIYNHLKKVHERKVIRLSYLYDGKRARATLYREMLNEILPHIMKGFTVSVPLPISDLDPCPASVILNYRLGVG